MFNDVKNKDFIICPVCKTQMMIAVGGYYKHTNPSIRCGYYVKGMDGVFTPTVKKPSNAVQAE